MQKTEKKIIDRDRQPWYADGLRFECTRCGDCCGGAPGVVWVSDEEIEALAGRLGIAEAEFRRHYTRRVDGGISLTEKANWDCVFYDRQVGCTVYEQRPLQCRTWPFWGKIVASPKTWEKTSRSCPGMNRGRVWDLVEIRVRAEKDGLHGERPGR